MILSLLVDLRTLCHFLYVCVCVWFFFKLSKPIADTKCSFIDTMEDLVALNEKLCNLTEFAVDLEVRNMSQGSHDVHPFYIVTISLIFKYG